MSGLHGGSFRWLLATVVLIAATTAAAAQDTRPNILFAIADDWSWPHAGAYGDSVVQTPTFDRLAREGALFQHAFVSSPSCTPSRGSIVTGHVWEPNGWSTRKTRRFISSRTWA